MQSSFKLSAQKVETWCAESLNEMRIYFSRLHKVLFIRRLWHLGFEPFFALFFNSSRWRRKETLLAFGGERDAC